MLLVGRYEVSWKEYIAAIEQRGCPVPTVSSKNGAIPFPGDIASAKDDLAVTGLRLVGVECYLAWLTEKTGRRYRLPTVAEWVTFASAGATTRFPWGDDLGFNNAVVYPAYDQKLCPTTDIDDSRFGTSHLRGCFAPNAFGLYDVIGNAGELTSETKMMDSADCPSCTPEGRMLGVVKGTNVFGYSLDYVSLQFLSDYSDGLRVVAEPDRMAKAKR
jgi:formylglycine-generating enzyme required for sulfatase activity